MDPQIATCLLVTSTVVSAIATVAIGIFSYLTMNLAKSNVAIADRVAWLTGALESHSEVRLKLDAKRDGVEMIWWDPTVSPVPIAPKHGERVELSTIYLFVPQGLRIGKEKLKYSVDAH